MDPPVLKDRPSHVVDAISHNKQIYYFGIGSNMSREKLMNRSVCGKKINPLSIEPAIVGGHRLAFNFKNFVPLEPVMASIEPIAIIHQNKDATNFISEPLSSFEKNECHGALILLNGDDYDRVMRSEGVGVGKNSFFSKLNDNPNQIKGYEEVVVTAVPYDKTKPPVTAVTLRCRPASRLERDMCPSPRYMNIIKSGAMELGLCDDYVRWLEQYPVQKTPRFVQRLAAYNSICSILMGMKFSVLRRFFLFQSQLLFAIHIPSTNESNSSRVLASNIATGIILFPGSIFGFLVFSMKEMIGLKVPPMMMGILNTYK